MSVHPFSLRVRSRSPLPPRVHFSQLDMAEEVFSWIDPDTNENTYSQWIACVGSCST